MSGLIRRRHVIMVWRTFGLKVAVRVLLAPKGATFLSLLF